MLSLAARGRTTIGSKRPTIRAPCQLTSMRNMRWSVLYLVMNDCNAAFPSTCCKTAAVEQRAGWNLMGQQRRWRVMSRTWIITTLDAERSQSLLLVAVDAKAFLIRPYLCASDSPHSHKLLLNVRQHLHGHIRRIHITTEHVRTSGKLLIIIVSTVFQFV